MMLFVPRVEKVQPLIVSRRETEVVEESAGGVWVLREAPVPYGAKTTLKNGCKA